MACFHFVFLGAVGASGVTIHCSSASLGAPAGLSGVGGSGTAAVRLSEKLSGVGGSVGAVIRCTTVASTGGCPASSIIPDWGVSPACGCGVDWTPSVEPRPTTGAKEAVP